MKIMNKDLIQKNKKSKKIMGWVGLRKYYVTFTVANAYI